MLRVTGADVPMPYNKHLERAAKADPPKVVAAVKRVLYLESDAWQPKSLMEALSPTMEEGRLVEWKKRKATPSPPAMCSPRWRPTRR